MRGEGTTGLHRSKKSGRRRPTAILVICRVECSASAEQVCSAASTCVPARTPSTGSKFSAQSIMSWHQTQHARKSRALAAAQSRLRLFQLAGCAASWLAGKETGWNRQNVTCACRQPARQLSARADSRPGGQFKQPQSSERPASCSVHLRDHASDSKSAQAINQEMQGGRQRICEVSVLAPSQPQLCGYNCEQQGSNGSHDHGPIRHERVPARV